MDNKSGGFIISYKTAKFYCGIFQYCKKLHFSLVYYLLYSIIKILSLSQNLLNDKCRFYSFAPYFDSLLFPSLGYI